MRIGALLPMRRRPASNGLGLLERGRMTSPPSPAWKSVMTSVASRLRGIGRQIAIGVAAGTPVIVSTDIVRNDVAERVVASRANIVSAPVPRMMKSSPAPPVRDVVVAVP
jgi:hypothetical protein